MPESFNAGEEPPRSGPPGAGDGEPHRPGDHGEFFNRVVRYLNDDMSREELDVLNDELKNDPAKQDIFVRASFTLAAVSEELSTQYHVFRQTLVADELRTARGKVFPAKDDSPSPPGRRWRPWAVAAALALLVIPAAIAAYLQHHTPVHVEPFASVTNSYRAQWTRGPNAGGGIPPTQELSLASGWVEITYRTGTKVTLIGPAIVSADAPNELAVRSGRLSAVVSDKNFSVRTPDLRVLDLGTEFGVSVRDRTDIAVFSGKVDAGSNKDSAAANHRVFVAGDAVYFDAGRFVIDTEQAWPQLFPRRLADGVMSLSLTDLLSGGEGTMDRREAALDVGTGQWTRDGLTLVPASTPGDHTYHKVPGLLAVDGCFVPDGASPIDSEGHTFNFSKTTNASFNQLRVGGVLPWPHEDGHRMRTILQGVDYAAAPHTFLEMHSNKGITLDLEALRAIHPEITFGEFRAVLGNSFPLYQGGEPFVAKTGVYVLVDGQAKFVNDQFSNQDPPVLLRVPITPEDRFLTIVVTDGGDGLDGDWVLLGDAEFTLTATRVTP